MAFGTRSQCDDLFTQMEGLRIRFDRGDFDSKPTLSSCKRLRSVEEGRCSHLCNEQRSAEPLLRDTPRGGLLRCILITLKATSHLQRLEVIKLRACGLKMTDDLIFARASKVQESEQQSVAKLHAFSDSSSASPTAAA